MSSKPIGFIHASPLAIAPLMQFYGEQAGELRVTNLLDDGILRYFAAADEERAERRLAAMVATARDEYGVRAAMLTCSAATAGMMRSIEATAGIPVFKIDSPMAEEAVGLGGRIGVAITFAPTLEATTKLLRAAAEAAGREVELVPVVRPEAHRAMLGGDVAEHDRLLGQVVDELVQAKVDAIVLAQVSMARVWLALKDKLGVPLLCSLPSSLRRFREILAEE